MPTINVNRTGHGIGTANSNFSTARTGNASSVTDGLSDIKNVQFISSRGSHRFNRLFLHFDTSGITQTLSEAHIDIDGGSSSPDPNDVIMIKSTAFGGDGGTALATTDMFSSLDYDTAYSDELTSHSLNNNEFTLTSDALADIKDNDNFTLAIIDHDADYANTDTAATSDMSFNFGVTITLDYTVSSSGPANLTNYQGIAKASITSINGITIANITTLNGVS